MSDLLAQSDIGVDGEEAPIVVKNIRLTPSLAHLLRLRKFHTLTPEAAIVREALAEYFYRHRNDLKPS